MAAQTKLKHELQVKAGSIEDCKTSSAEMLAYDFLFKMFSFQYLKMLCLIHFVF